MIPTPHQIEILKADEPDIWGEPTYSEKIPVNGNIRSANEVVVNQYGEEVVSKHTILFKGFVDITVNDKVKFTEPNGQIVESSPIQVKFMRDLDGSVKFTKVVI